MNDNISSTPPVAASSGSCHGGAPGSLKRRSWRSGLVIVGALAALAGVLAFAVDQRWLALSALAPLLYSLPCALMMFMCMRGMNRRACAETGADRDKADEDLASGMAGGPRKQ